ncbi:glycoside hydrolase family 2 protein [Flavivirga rizhaonensis]|uniref:Glycoside hydrolase family 2 protein n=2 Tax=Flavivirga rizhaonensis TaxID=2559571 RepID=A0A4S1E044_9FLAO|nr:glycoside hydrolase family 2 protein [Flavivirga rizhaonensis]
MVYAQEPEFSKAGFWEVKNSGRDVFNFNVGWRFTKGDVKGAEATNFDDSNWALVNTPHGLEYNSSEVSGSSNYQGPAWYRKHFKLDKNTVNKILKLHFEAVMGKCKVWLNGVQIGEHYGGYLPFTVKLNDHLIKDGDNVLAVWADNSDDASYPPGKPQNRLDFTYFGGIYRDVWLVATHHVYVTNPNEANKVAGGGVFIHTQKISETAATVFTKVDIRNDFSKTTKIKANLRILNKKGEEVAKASQNVTLSKGKSSVVTKTFNISNPKLWAPWSPDLYRLEVVLTAANGEKLDGVATKFGIRIIDFKGEDGLYLNNKAYPRKLMGVNRHQDHGYVGYAISNNGQWRDAVLLKNGGSDVIRAAHYPADPAFMDACDALGLFYINATPGWQFWSDIPLFEKRVYEDIAQMVRRDRNYASVIMWEPILNETKYPEHFAKKAHDIVHEEYPYQGAFTVCDKRAGGQEHYDVLYSHDNNAKFDGSEKRSYFCREFGDNVDDFNAQNSTSRTARGWGERAQLIQAKYYAFTDADDYTTWETLYNTPRQFVGGTLWHAFDHQRGYNPDPFFGGLTDVFRQKKYSYHMFESQRDVSDTNEPMVFIAHEMTPFSDSDVTVFTNCEEVRLTLFEGEKIIQKKVNKSVYKHILTPQGQPNITKIVGEKAMPHPYVVFKDIYDFFDLKGMHRARKKHNASIVAEGLIDGKVVTSFTRVSGKHPTKLKLSLESQNIPLVADGSDFVLVVVSMVDEKGNTKRLHENTVKFEVFGEGEIIGDASIEANPKRLSWGTAPLLVRSTTKAGKIRIKASLVHQGINSPLPGELVIESVLSKDVFINSEIGSENNSLASLNRNVKVSSEDELKNKIRQLEKELINMKLKIEEKNQKESDENR